MPLDTYPRMCYVRGMEIIGGLGLGLMLLALLMGDIPLFIAGVLVVTGSAVIDGGLNED